MQQPNVLVRVKHAVGNALSPNQAAGDSWRKSLRRVYLRRVALPKQTFRVGLERPAARETVANSIQIKGWAVSLTGEQITARVLLDGQFAAPLPIDVRRDDVAGIFALSASESQVGFDSSFEWNKYCLERDKVELCIELSHGNEALVLGPITISRTNSPLLLHERGSYKEVWNSASTDHGYAMESVAGTRDYASFMESGKDTASTIRDALAITINDIVLEIGCGTGRIGAALAPQCREWIGSDISGQMLSYAADNLKHLPNVRLVELSTCGLEEFADESLDKIYCSTVFMHLDEWDRYRYVQESFRALKPGGALYIDNLNLCGDIGWSIFQSTAKLDAALRPPSVSKTSTPEELHMYLARAGFADIKLFPGSHLVAARGTKPQH